MTRKNGYYWVKLKDSTKWQIAYWEYLDSWSKAGDFANGRYWRMMGIGLCGDMVETLKDSDFDEIDEHRITRNLKKYSLPSHFTNDFIKTVSDNDLELLYMEYKLETEKLATIIGYRKAKKEADLAIKESEL